MRQLRAIAGLDTTSEAFRRKLIGLSDRLGIDPSMLAAVMAFESGFDPHKRNAACMKRVKKTGGDPGNCAVGLIQFTPVQVKTLGTTMNAVAALDALGQLDWVEKHYAFVIGWKGPLSTLEDHYLAVFAPAFVGAQPNEPLPYSETKYADNAPLDTDGDGVITAGEATAHVRSIYDAAQSKPPILVDMEAPDDAVNVGIVGAALVVALMAWGFSSYKHKAKLA